MRDANNRAAACNATHGASVVAYSAVGTKAYAAGGTYNCPQSNPTPKPGGVGFPSHDGGKTPIVRVNGVDVDQLSPLPGKALSGTPFTTFMLRDKLTYHTQRWTFTARLYRDNVFVEELTGKSSAASATDVEVTFTEQPNSFALGHTWKVTTHYEGSGYADVSKSFFFQ
jgi:hypothetical protein